MFWYWDVFSRDQKRGLINYVTFSANKGPWFFWFETYLNPWCSSQVMKNHSWLGSHSLFSQNPLEDSKIVFFVGVPSHGRSKFGCYSSLSCMSSFLDVNCLSCHHQLSSLDIIWSFSWSHWYLRNTIEITHLKDALEHISSDIIIKIVRPNLMTVYFPVQIYFYRRGQCHQHSWFE